MSKQQKPISKAATPQNAVQPAANVTEEKTVSKPVLVPKIPTDLNTHFFDEFVEMCGKCKNQDQAREALAYLHEEVETNVSTIMYCKDFLELKFTK